MRNTLTNYHFEFANRVRDVKLHPVNRFLDLPFYLLWQLQCEEDGQMFYSLDDGTTKFTDLIQLVEFYQLNRGVLPCKLKHPCTMVALWPPSPKPTTGSLNRTMFHRVWWCASDWLFPRQVLCRHSCMISRGHASTKMAVMKLPKGFLERYWLAASLDPLVNSKGSSSCHQQRILFNGPNILVNIIRWSVVLGRSPWWWDMDRHKVCCFGTISRTRRSWRMDTFF